MRVVFRSVLHIHCFNFWKELSVDGFQSHCETCSQRNVVCWLCLVRRDGGNSLILEKIVAVLGSVELEGPVMPVS